jgi:hypothetical protein
MPLVTCVPLEFALTTIRSPGWMPVPAGIVTEYAAADAPEALIDPALT